MRLSGPNRRKQLLDSALALFAKQGYQGTTTREIANRAGVTEAIIYRHFPKKEDLYWAVLEEQCRARQAKVEADQAALDDDNASDEQIFTRIAEGILRRNNEDPTLNRLSLFSALENHELSARFYRTFTATYFAHMAEQIQKRIRAGSFRAADPLIAARSFIGMIYYHYLIQELFGGSEDKVFDIQKTAREITRIWLQGMSTTANS